MTAAYALLGRTCDYLFLAETWYVDHAVLAKDRCVVATTVRPEDYTQTRPSGGLYLLATQNARSKINGECDIRTEASISFTVGNHRIGGVYLPPSMVTGDVEI